MISIPIRPGGKNSPNLRNKRVARLSVPAPAPQFFCWLARPGQLRTVNAKSVGWGGTARVQGGQRQREFLLQSFILFKRLAFDGYFCNLYQCMRYSRTCRGYPAMIKTERSSGWDLLAELKNFNIVVTEECEVEQSWSGWCRCSTIGLVGQVLQILTDDSMACLVFTQITDLIHLYQLLCRWEHCYCCPVQWGPVLLLDRKIIKVFTQKLDWRTGGGSLVTAKTREKNMKTNKNLLSACWTQFTNKERKKYLHNFYR